MVNLFHIYYVTTNLNSYIDVIKKLIEEKNSKMFKIKKS
jgi:hypothetical protein